MSLGQALQSAQINDWYEAGQRAKSLEDCPHEPDTTARLWWVRGFSHEQQIQGLRHLRSRIDQLEKSL